MGNLIGVNRKKSAQKKVSALLKELRKKLSPSEIHEVILTAETLLKAEEKSPAETGLFI